MAPLAAEAQPRAKVPRIGLLRFAVPNAPQVQALRQGLRDLGWVEGQNLAIEVRSAEGKVEQLPGLAAELVRLGVDLIFTSGPEATLRAASEATRTIPIVMVAVDYDPIALGYVAGLPRPGGNITGVVSQQLELTGKRLEMLKETVPTATRMAVFWDALSADQLKAANAAARALGVELQPVELQNPPVYDFGRAFTEVSRARAGALLVLMSPLFAGGAAPEWDRIPNLALKHQLPTIFGVPFWVEAGGLMSYGPNLLAMFRHAATHVDKILKGAQPATLPVEQPTRFELVVNLRTAKTLGLTIPQSILIRADRVIP